MLDVLILNGTIIDGTGLPGYHGDLAIQGDRIEAIGRLSQRSAKETIDATGKIVAPGFIDAHVHGDLALFDDPLHEPAIRQGVTTYVLGQDGVAMAPASPTTLGYVRRYTAGFSGLWEPPREFFSVADYLAGFDRKCAINVATLIPNGNVRMDVMGLEHRSPTSQELKQMRAIVREAMEQGAVGISSGLDYVPSLFAEVEEMAELCKEIAPFDGVYVSHVRSYAPTGVIAALDELFNVGRRAKCGVQISHFNSQAHLVLPHLDQVLEEGLDVTYDLYCYLAGSSILAMLTLPVWAQEGGHEATLERLKDPEVRERLRTEESPRKAPLDQISLSFVASPEYQECEGMTLADAAKQAGSHVMDFVCDVLIASDLAVGCVAPHRKRTDMDIQALIQHPAMMAGSDGIYTGGYPHPRGWGCFARYLGHHVREERTWTWEQAVQHLSAHAARRFGLKDRGVLMERKLADIVIFDPETISDRSTYEQGRQLAVGMDFVLVNGEVVLRAGERTEALPGRGLRRGD